jgi:hypothetical protein
MRLIGFEKNFLRFIIKTMSKKMIILIIFSKLFQIIGALLIKSMIAKGIFIAFIKNLLELKGTFLLRKKVMNSAKNSSDYLLNKFINNKITLHKA